MVGFSGLLYDYPDHLALANVISSCNQKIAPKATLRDVSSTVLLAHWCVVRWLSPIAAAIALIVNGLGLVYP